MAKRLSLDELGVNAAHQTTDDLVLEADPSQLREGAEVAERLASASEILRSNILKSEDLESGLENLPVPDAKGDPRVAALAGDIEQVRLKIARHHIPPPMQPSHGTNSIDAKSVLRLQAFKRDELNKKNRGGKLDYSKTVSYVVHDCEDCNGPGIWIYGEPTRQLTPDNWDATYKARGSHWPGGSRPYCQCCFERYGTRPELRGVNFLSSPNPGPEQVHNGLIANQRYVRTLTEDEFKALWVKDSEPVETATA